MWKCCKINYLTNVITAFAHFSSASSRSHRASRFKVGAVFGRSRSAPNGNCKQKNVNIVYVFLRIDTKQLTRATNAKALCASSGGSTTFVWALLPNVNKAYFCYILKPFLFTVCSVNNLRRVASPILRPTYHFAGIIRKSHNLKYRH